MLIAPYGSFFVSIESVETTKPFVFGIFVFDTRGRNGYWLAQPPGLNRGDPYFLTLECNIVAKPEWGTKRMCPGCGVRFYDMKRTPVTCPARETAVPTEIASRTRKSAPATKTAAPVPVPVEVAKTEIPGVEGNSDDIDVADVEVEIEDDDDDDEDSLIEDASDLADDDMPEIADHIEKDSDTDS